MLFKIRRWGEPVSWRGFPNWRGASLPLLIGLRGCILGTQMVINTQIMRVFGGWLPVVTSILKRLWFRWWCLKRVLVPVCFVTLKMRRWKRRLKLHLVPKRHVPRISVLKFARWRRVRRGFILSVIKPPNLLVVIMVMLTRLRRKLDWARLFLARLTFLARLRWLLVIFLLSFTMIRKLRRSRPFKTWVKPLGLPRNLRLATWVPLFLT